MEKVNTTIKLKATNPFCAKCGDTNAYGVFSESVYCKKHYLENEKPKRPSRNICSICSKEKFAFFEKGIDRYGNEKPVCDECSGESKKGIINRE